MVMDEELYQTPKTTTIEDLNYELEQAWNKITLKCAMPTLIMLCDKLPEIIKRKAEFIKKLVFLDYYLMFIVYFRF